MKKIISLFLCVSILLSVGACSKKAVMTWQEQYDLGVRYLSEGNYKEAIIAFETAIKIEPGNLDSYLRAAEAYLASGDKETAANALVRGYIATGDEEPLWKLISEVNPPDIFGDSYWGYWVEGVTATYYAPGKDPDSQALSDQVFSDKYFGSEVGGCILSGSLITFDESLPIEICGEHLTIEQANANFYSDISDDPYFGRDYSGQQVILSGYISFNTELYRIAQLHEAEIVQGDANKRVLIWLDDSVGKYVEYWPGGVWSLSMEQIEVVP